MVDPTKIFQVLDYGSKEDKIKTLESLNQSNNMKIIRKIISKLDDPEIRVRGEAFSSLLLNENDISAFLINELGSVSKNVKGYLALILANRNDSKAIHSIELLTKDPSSIVRACALGALGHLCSNQSSAIIRNCFTDEMLEVRKSALDAFFKIGGKIFSSEAKQLTKDADDELVSLVKKISKYK